MAILEGIEATALFGPAAGIHGADVVGLLCLFAAAGGYRIIPMQRGDVVSIGAVFALQFPIAVVQIGRGAAQDFETFGRLIYDQIDDFGGFAQMLP